jgi:hypothetical protein
MKAETLFALADGSLTWSDAVYNGAVLASGERSDMSAVFTRIRL